MQFAGDRVPLGPLDVKGMQLDAIKPDPEAQPFQPAMAAAAAGAPLPLPHHQLGTPPTAALLSQATPSGDTRTGRHPTFPEPSLNTAAARATNGRAPLDACAAELDPLATPATPAQRADHASNTTHTLPRGAAATPGSAACPLVVASDTDGSSAALGGVPEEPSVECVKAEPPGCPEATPDALRPTPAARATSAASEVAVVAPSARSAHSASAVFASARASGPGRKRSLVDAARRAPSGKRPCAASHASAAMARSSSPAVLQGRGDEGVMAGRVKEEGHGGNGPAAAADAVAACEVEVAQMEQELVAARQSLRDVQAEWPAVHRALEVELVRPLLMPCSVTLEMALCEPAIVASAIGAAPWAAGAWPHVSISGISGKPSPSPAAPCRRTISGLTENRTARRSLPAPAGTGLAGRAPSVPPPRRLQHACHALRGTQPAPPQPHARASPVSPSPTTHSTHVIFQHVVPF